MGQPFGRYERIYEITWHVPVARAKGAPPLVAQGHMPTQLSYRHTKFEWNPFIGLACSLDNNFFARVGTLARGTCHVAPIAPRLAPSSFRRSGASNGASPVPIGPGVRAPGAKMLGQIHRQANTISPTFFSDPTEEIFEHKGSNANAFESFILYDFE